MPLALVRFNPDRIPEPIMARITPELPGIIALALHVQSNPEAHLTAEDVEIDARAFNALDVTGPYDLTVFVLANRYEERLAFVDDEKTIRFIDQAAKMIGEDVLLQLQRFSFTGERSRRIWIWPFLGDASFIDLTS